MKNKHKNIASLTGYFLPVAISIFLTFQSCSSFCKVKNSPVEVVQDTHEQEGFIKATVINYIDGCAFLLQLTDGKKLEPVNLSEEYKKENTNVWFKYVPYKGSSICMAGQMVTITKIEKDSSSGNKNLK
ncbi:MAG: hypothetical protein V4608_00235 [Bacteroidota bacterium]